MHIHKPRAPHSLPEFLSEISVIVVGVMIAIGLEQTVELFHWQHVVKEERQALTVEIGELDAGMQARFELEPCFRARLTEVKTIIHRHDESELLRIVGPLGRVLYAPLLQPTWDLALSDGSLAHMSLPEKRRFMDAYSWVSIFRAISGDEREAWRSLEVLNDASTLTVADWSQVRKDYQHAVETDGIVWGSRQAWTEPLIALRAKVDSISVRSAPPVEAFCTSMLAPAQPG